MAMVVPYRRVQTICGFGQSQGFGKLWRSRCCSRTHEITDLGPMFVFDPEKLHFTLQMADIKL